MAEIDGRSGTRRASRFRTNGICSYLYRHPRRAWFGVGTKTLTGVGPSEGSDRGKRAVRSNRDRARGFVENAFCSQFCTYRFSRLDGNHPHILDNAIVYGPPRSKLWKWMGIVHPIIVRRITIYTQAAYANVGFVAFISKCYIFGKVTPIRNERNEKSRR